MGNRQKLRQAAVNQIEQDLMNIGSADLEFVGHSMIKLLEDRDLIHRGLNRDAKPVGYTVDTFSDDRMIVGEYSTEADYFEEPYGKITRDSKHAKDHAPKCKKVYLISSQGVGNSDWKEIESVAKKVLPAGADAVIYDGRRLSEAIYDQVIQKNNLVEYFADFLPSLLKVWTENAISHAVPETPFDYVADAARTKAITELLAKHPVVAVHGISGTGKSYAAIDYSSKHEGSFRNIMWVSGRELEGIGNLAAVKIARMGVDINLASKLSASACLLVVDDWRGDAADVSKLLPSTVHPGTRVLVTCIDKPSGAMVSLELPTFSKPAAEKILHLGLNEKPSDQQSAEICRRVGYHPLTLAIIRDAVREGGVSWEVIINDLPNIPNYEDANHETILQRILLNHSVGASDELKTLRLLGAVVLDAKLALSVLGVAGLPKLLRRSLLRKDARGICRMHDLVHTCLRHFDGGNISENEVAARLKQFFAANWETGSYHFHRSLQIHAATIQSWVNLEAPEPSLESYLFLLAESISKPTQLLEALRGRAIEAFPNQREACLSIVEAIEMRYQNEMVEAEKERILDEGINNITTGVAKATDPRLTTDLLHHRGKLFLWRKKADEAVKDFSAVLARDPQYFQSHLQMARLKAQTQDPSCSEHVESILSAFAAEQESVSITLALAAFTELEKRANQNLREKWLVADPSRFSEAISLAVAEGFSQPYRTLGRLSRYIFYPHPQVLLTLAELVSFPPPAAAKDRECFEIAECMKSVGKACLDERGDDWGHKQWCERALEFYQKTANPNEFQSTMQAECLIRLKRFDEALSCLDSIANVSNQAHWWHRRAQALLGLGKEEDALVAINRTLGANQDERYLSAFLQVKAQIEAALGLATAVTTLEEAVSKVNNEKFKAALEAELTDLRKRFQ